MGTVINGHECLDDQRTLICSKGTEGNQLTIDSILMKAKPSMGGRRVEQRP